MIRRLPFWKVQSIGNDFPLIHFQDLQNLDPQSNLNDLLPKLAIDICDRRFGVGGDGLLAVSKEPDEVRLRMFNPDGTEDFCGNGIRCAAVHAHSQGWVGDSFVIGHRDRKVPVEIDGATVRTTIGVADYTPEKIPLLGPELFNATVWSGIDGGTPLSLFGSVLTTGSTHTIIPTSCLPDDETFRSVSAKIEVDPKFPERTSVIWRQEVAPNVLKLRIWERGVGETLGCGTGSSAAAADYLRRSGRGGRVEVQNPGGTVFVEMAAWNAPVTIEGQAQEVYSGQYLWETSYAPV
jgi:diaminopimelate epimerase